jgi:hypothetical protein
MHVGAWLFDNIDMRFQNQGSYVVMKAVYLYFTCGPCVGLVIF